MLTREQVIDALKQVKEPSLHRSLAELGLIRDILIKDDVIRLTVVLYELNEEEERRIEQEIKQLLKHEQTYVRFRKMTDIEMEQTRAKLEGGENAGRAASPKPKTHADGLQSSILSPESGVKFIAVASGKGGVGKSTVTVNLAAALARRGKKAAIVDADIYGFSIPDMMGIEEQPKLVDKKIIPVERFGVKVISMAFFVKDNAPVVWRGPMLGKMLRNFFGEVEWGEVDYMLLDLPPGTGDIALDVHQMIPQSKEIIVTTPHATAAFVAARAGAMAMTTEHEILGVVENMAYYECAKCGEKEYLFGRGGGGKLAEELRTELLAQIPIGLPDNHPSEPDFSPSVYKHDTTAGKIYDELAARIEQKMN